MTPFSNGIIAFFATGAWSKSRPNSQEDTDYLNKLLEAYTSITGSTTSLQTLPEPFTTEEIAHRLQRYINTIYSWQPYYFYFFPWHISNIRIQIPEGNYVTRSKLPTEPDVAEMNIEDTINSAFLNAGIDPSFGIVYTVNPNDGRSIFSRPATKPLFDDNEIRISDQSGNIQEKGAWVISEITSTPSIGASGEWLDVKDLSGSSITRCCATPLVAYRVRKYQTRAGVPLLPNSPINNKGALPFYEASGNYGICASGCTLDASGSWMWGHPYYSDCACDEDCSGNPPTTGIPYISSFKLLFNVDGLGYQDLDNPLVLKLGWALGFRLGTYGVTDVAISDALIDITPPKYVYICINDFNPAQNNWFTAAFSESTLSPYILGRLNYAANFATSNTQDDGFSSALNRTREYFGPVDIQRLHVQILDEYGRVVDLNGMDWSATLVYEVLYD